MAPKVPSFVKRSKNPDEIFKVEDVKPEVPLAATPISQVPTPVSAQNQTSLSSKRKLAQTTLDLSGSSQTRSMRKGKAVKVDPALAQNQFKDMIDTHVPPETVVGWAKMDATEAMQAMRFSAAQNAFFTLRFCDDFAEKTQYDLRLQGEVSQLKKELAATEERVNTATAAVRRMRTVETSLKNDKMELQEQVKNLRDEKIGMLEKTNELEAQVDALNAAAESVKTSTLAIEKARYDEGYDEGIRDYMRSMWEKMPELNWSLLGDDVVGMIEDFKKEAAVNVPVPPATAVERSPGVTPVTTEATGSAPQEIPQASPSTAMPMDDSTKLPEA